MPTRIILLVLIVCSNYAKLLANNAQMATETARETWWYFKSHLHNPKWKQGDFMVRTAEGKWIGNLVSGDRIRYKGCVIGEKPGEFTKECIEIDSAGITDWAFSDNGVIRGAFMLRISKVEKPDKQVLIYTGCKLVMNRTVGDDFIALSRWKGVGFESDSVNYYFFESRFRGGIEKFYTYLDKAVTYPSFARKIGLQGYCYVSFAVEKNGKISNPVVLQSIGGGCRENTYKVIRELPEMCEDEHSQSITFTLPIRYSLR